MNGFLVDTNVLSEFGKTKEPDANVRRRVETADPRSLFASVVTWGELRKGIESKRPDQRRSGLEQWLEHDLREVSIPPFAGNQDDRQPLGSPRRAIQAAGKSAHDG